MLKKINIYHLPHFFFFYFFLPYIWHAEVPEPEIKPVPQLCPPVGSVTHWAARELLPRFFILFWSIVDLQCCISFRCTAKWFSYTYTHIRSFSDYFPVSRMVLGGQESRSSLTAWLWLRAGQRPAGAVVSWRQDQAWRTIFQGGSSFMPGPFVLGADRKPRVFTARTSLGLLECQHGNWLLPEQDPRESKEEKPQDAL